MRQNICDAVESSMSENQWPPLQSTQAYPPAVYLQAYLVIHDKNLWSNYDDDR